MALCGSQLIAVDALVPRCRGFTCYPLSTRFSLQGERAILICYLFLFYAVKKKIKSVDCQTPNNIPYGRLEHVQTTLWAIQHIKMTALTSSTTLVLGPHRVFPLESFVHVVHGHVESYMESDMTRSHSHSSKNLINHATRIISVKVRWW